MNSLRSISPTSKFPVESQALWYATLLMVWSWTMAVGLLILSSFFQREFFNPDTVLPFLGIATGCELILSMLLLGFERFKSMMWLWWGLFIMMSGAVTLLLFWIHWNQSMFFLLYLTTIISSGLALKSQGSYLIGFISMLGFNLSVLISPQEKFLGSMLTLVVNNLALFIVAFLSGQLTDYLENLGIKLDLVTKNLKTMTNLHELILRHIPTGIITVDQFGSVIQANEAAQKIVTTEVSKLANAATNALGQSELVLEGLKGELKTVRCERVRFEIEDVQDQATIFVLEDVTKVRQLEEGLRNQEKLAAIGKLAAGIAHEIRNPLASISGSVQLLSTQAGTAEDQKLFNIVIRETDRLNLLITEFLDYAKPLPKPTDRISLTGILKEVLDLVTYNKKLRVDVQQERCWTDEVYVLGYRDKLKQAFLNMIINAYQAMEKIEQPVLRVEVARESGVITVRIRDNGSGMKEETRKRIFEPFYTTKSQGTGLGLAVTHKIFEGHEASILVESHEGNGTEFVIMIKEAATLI